MRHHATFLTRICLVLCALLVLPARVLAQAEPEPFAPGDRWSAIGDSITHGGSYHSWIWLYYLTRFPDRTIDLTNAGISGDTAEGGVRRAAWDILPGQPTVATVMFGMNDVGRPLYNEPAPPEAAEQRAARLAGYRENQRTLVLTLKEHGTRVILLTPSMFDETADLPRPKQTGVNEALAECAAFLKTLAAETGASLVDFHGPMTRLNADLQRADPKTTIVGPDRVHPGPPGHLLMAYLFLRAQRVPADVARLSIDAGKKRVVSATNGRAEKIRRHKGELTFVWTENALPFPVSPEAAPALGWVPLQADLNQEVLQVAGLAPGRYEVRIDDDAPLGPFSAGDLASGVNLAEQKATPQYRQALEVLGVVEKRRLLVADKLRRLAQVEHRLAPANAQPVTLEAMKPLLEEQRKLFETQPPTASSKAAIEAYPEIKAQQADSLAAAAALATSARRAALPRPHTYRVRPVAGEGGSVRTQPAG